MQETKQQPEGAVDVSSTRLLCPIHDKEWRPMNVGDRFKYQVGTPFEAVATIELRNGVEWLTWSDGTSDIPLADFWYAPTDERLSLLLA